MEKTIRLKRNLDFVTAISVILFVFGLLMLWVFNPSINEKDLLIGKIILGTYFLIVFILKIIQSETKKGGSVDLWMFATLLIFIALIGPYVIKLFEAISWLFQ